MTAVSLTPRAVSGDDIRGVVENTNGVVPCRSGGDDWHDLASTPLGFFYRDVALTDSR